MPDEKDLVEEIFNKAIEMESPEARLEYLKTACQDRDDLRAKVVGLIEAHAAAGDFLQKQFVSEDEFTKSVDVESDSEATHDARVPGKKSSQLPERSAMIGPYKLLQVIGEGGMGTVWMAEQEQPVRRRVALKLIRAETGSKEVIARFEAERQALAIMDHPNIARVLDGGTTELGNPYFVMELVNGVPLNEFCDKNTLSIRERMELFVPICNAVQHAHQKGIIHRDLKPSNVLVTFQDGNPLPKVIDFGLAKALEHAHKLTDKTLFTEFGKVVGTLQYMSPEQAEMSALEVDTRTDIFSLGIMLYELLTGSTPIQRESLKDNAVLKLLAMIRDTEPPLPSARLSSSGEKANDICRHRKIEQSRLTQILKGDLDWVVMKAIEKDRARRYETASAFADDVKRYLNDEAVAARPPTFAYKVSKFVKKNRGWVVAGSVIVFLLVAGITGTSVGLYFMNEARKLADQKTIQVTEEKNRADFERDRAHNETKKVEKYAAELTGIRKEIRKKLYVADMQWVAQDWQAGMMRQVGKLLQRQIPADQEEDNRTFVWYFFKRLYDRLENVPTIGYGEIVSVVEAIPGSNEIAAFGNDGTIQIWQRGGKSPKQILVHELGKIQKLVCSKDGKLLAAASRRGYGIWRYEENQFKFLFNDQVLGTRIQFAKQLPVFVAQSGTTQLKIWDLSSSRSQSKMLELEDTIQAFYLLASNAIAISKSKGEIQLYDLKTLRPVSEAVATRGPVKQILQPDSEESRFYALRADGIELFEVHDNQVTRYSEIDCQCNSLEYALVGDEGEIIAIGQERVDFFDGKSGQRLGRDGSHIHDMEDLNQAAIFDSQTGLLIGAGRDRNLLSLWSVDGKRQGKIKVNSNVVYALAMNGQGEVISGGRDKKIRFSRVDLAREYDLLGRHTRRREPAWIWSVAFSSDDRLLASCADDRKVKVWDVKERKLSFEMTEHRNSVQFVVFSPDNRTLASASRDNTIRLTDVESRKVVAVLAEHQGAVNSLSYSSDGKKLASASDDGKLIVWDLDTNQPEFVHQLEEGERAALWAVQFDPDDKGIFFGGTNHRIQYLVMQPEPKVTWTFDTEFNLTSLAISPDGRYLSATASNGFVSLFDCSSKDLIVQFEKHSSDVMSTAFTPDSKTLATGAHDGKLRFWNLATNERTASYAGHNEHVHCVRFSNDGKILASGSWDGTIRLWIRE